MAQVPERCMQMLKQIITEIENRQNITREQLALLLETTDTGDIAFPVSYTHLTPADE